jgi:DNA-binding transcriptional LysR family regulator
MEDLRRLAIFAAVVDAGSFTAAARVLGMTKSGVSKQVSTLESRHGIQLLVRTTRSLRMTPPGEALYAAAKEMLAAANQGFASIAEQAQEARGSLRITAAIGMGASFVAPRLRAFMEANPHVDVELVLTDEQRNVVADGFDVAVRAGHLADSAFMARKLAEVPLVFCSSPGYVASAGPFATPDALARAEFAVFSPLGNPMRVEVHNGPRRQTLRLSGRVVTNHGPVVRRVVEDGGGVGILPRFYIREALAVGSLVTLLDNWSVGAVPVFAVYPATRNPSAALRALLDFLVSTAS